MKTRKRKTKENKSTNTVLRPSNYNTEWHMEWKCVGTYPNGMDRYEWVPVKGSL